MRRLFRYFRIACWLLVLFLVGAWVYLNQVGLPDFIKEPILTEMRQRGLDLHFSRLRLHWYRGIVAENVNFGQTGKELGPQVYIDDLEIRFNHEALRHLRLEVSAVVVRHARLSWRTRATGEAEWRQLSLEDVMADVQFDPDDRWVLSNAHGTFLGLAMDLQGAIRNASYLESWKSSAPSADPGEQVNAFWSHVVKIREQLQFDGPPTLKVRVEMDARARTLERATLRLEVPRVDSPWGEFRQVSLTISDPMGRASNTVAQTEVRLHAAQVVAGGIQLDGMTSNWRITRGPVNDLPTRVELGTTAESVTARDCTAHQLALNVLWNQASGESNQTCVVDARMREMATPWGTSGTGQVQVQLDLAPTLLTNIVEVGKDHAKLLQTGTWVGWVNALPAQERDRLKVAAHLQLGKVNTPQGHAEKLEVEITGNPSHLASNLNNKVDPSWGIWSHFVPWELSTRCDVWGVVTPELLAERLLVDVAWKSPELRINTLQGTLYDGEIALNGQLNVESRRLMARVRSNFDVHQVGIILPSGTQRWLRQYGWEIPPLVQGELCYQLPPWDNTSDDLDDDPEARLTLAATIQAGASSFRRAQAASTELMVTLTNQTWHIPHLLMSRPEGQLRLQYTEDSATHDHYWEGTSGIDPQALRPLLTEGQWKALKLFEFTTPPHVEGRFWGRWRTHDVVGFDGVIQAHDFTFRSEAITDARIPITLTNDLARAHDVRITHDQQTIEAQEVRFEIPERRLYLTNAKAQYEPGAVTRAIGPQTYELMKPYQFDQPPRVLVNGSVVVTNTRNADMTFELEGGPFRYSRFRMPLVSGVVHWGGTNLSITNLQGSFYNGRLKGNLDADLTPSAGTQAGFRVTITNVDMRSFMADVSSSTNRMEGTLSGDLVITRLNSSDWGSWQGYGQASLLRGLIWEIPMFGVFTPILNSIVPGIGNNRADQGTATFIITNSVISTRDLEIRTQTLRLYYNGTVDFDCNVNARVEASLFRDVWLVGRIFSIALMPLTKVFEYQVTGTLAQPKTQPLYIIPKVIMAPLHPLKTIKDIFTPEPTKPAEPAKDEKSHK